MIGDGELQEGEVWEGAMCAGHYRLNNLCGIVDYNKMQSDDLNENIMSLEPLRAKWEAFNWHVIEIDGHAFEEIGAAFTEARQMKGKPSIIIALGETEQEAVAVVCRAESLISIETEPLE